MSRRAPSSDVVHNENEIAKMYNNARRQRVLCEKYNSKWKSSEKWAHSPTDCLMPACWMCTLYVFWMQWKLYDVRHSNSSTWQMPFFGFLLFSLRRETRTSEGNAHRQSMPTVPENESIRCSSVNWRNFHSIARPHFLSFVAFRRTFYRKLNVKHWIWMISSPPLPLPTSLLSLLCAIACSMVSSEWIF